MPQSPREREATWQLVNDAQSRIRAEGLSAGIDGLAAAVQIFHDADERAAESDVLSILGSVHGALGNFEKEAACHRAGLDAARSLDKPGTRVVEHLAGLARALGNMGQWPRAVELCQEALRESDNKPIRDLRERRARILRHLAELYARYANRHQDALDLYDQAIEIARDYDDKFNIAATLTFKGQTLEQLNRSEEAFQLYEQARAIAETLNEPGLLAACCAHLGGAYLHLGRVPLARQYVERALALDRQCGNKQGISRDLWMLSSIYEKEGNEQEVFATLEQALLAAREIGDLKLVVFLLLRLARLSDRRLLGGVARQYLEEALRHSRELGDRHAEIEIGVSLAGYDAPAEFIAKLETAIGQARQHELRGLEQDLELSLAGQHERHGDLVQARDHYVRAAELLEQMRTGYRSEEHLRAFSEHQGRCYERLVEISLQLHEGPEAFLWAERSRARVLQMMRHSRGRAGAEWTDARRQQYRQVRDEILMLDHAIQQFEEAGAEVPSTVREQLQRALLVEADIALTARRAANVVEDHTTRDDINAEELVRRLDSLPCDVLMLCYYLGDAGGYVFCCTRGGFTVRDLKLDPKEVREHVRAFRARLGVGEVDVRGRPAASRAGGTHGDPIDTPAQTDARGHLMTGQRLYELLLRPVEAEIVRAQHISIIPHGPLHFLPFHALHDGERYLIERRPVSYAPSATTLAETLRSGALTLERALALGDPSSDLPPLPQAREEVEQVQKILGTACCRAEVGERAVRSLVLDAATRRSGVPPDDVWHFAMHAVFVQAAPHLSYLQLASRDGDDGRLFGHEIAALDRVGTMNVLSACRTAMTREAKGDELSGLLFSFLVAGAQTVLATLWSVDDDCTAELMVELYRSVRQGNVSLAEALRQAQIAVLRRPSTSSPYYWAPIVLQGNWNPMPIDGAGQVEREHSTPLPDATRAAEIPIEVLIRRADSLMGRAKIEGDRQRLTFLPPGERQALGEAITVYTDVLNREPDHAVALRQRGIALYCLLQYDRAELDLRQAYALKESDAVAAAMLGVIHADEKKDSRAAARYLEQAFLRDPRLELSYPSRKTYLLRQALERCRAEICVEECTARLREFPHDARIYTERGHAHWLLSLHARQPKEHWDAALRDLQRAIDIDPANPLALVKKTWIESKGDGSVEVYAKAVEMDPTCAEAHLRLGSALRRTNGPRAIAELRAALACDPSVLHAGCRLAECYLDAGDLRGACQAFEAEVERNPNCFDSHLYLTHIYSALGRQDDARRALHESIRTSSRDAHQGGPGVGLADDIVYAIRDLARRALAAGDTDGAAAVGLAEIRSLFARAQNLAQERPREAVEIYSEIIRRDSNNGRALAFRGGCYAALGDAHAAMADLERATKLNSANADAWFNLYLVYDAQKRPDDARVALERARIHDPEMVRRKLDGSDGTAGPTGRGR